jgi:hypothetical protein
MFGCFFRILVLEEDFILLQKAIWFISCCYLSITHPDGFHARCAPDDDDDVLLTVSSESVLCEDFALAYIRFMVSGSIHS